MSTNRNNQLPFGSPTLTVTVRKGVHNGQSQLWAPYQRDGKDYKLILDTRRHTPVAGEEWEVYPEHSPNGHIIFCRVSRQLKTASGKHPFVERTARHVQNGWTVSIRQLSPRDGQVKQGSLREVKVEGDLLSITFYWKGQPFTFSCWAEYARGWRNKYHLGSDRFSGDCYGSVDDRRYLVVFSDCVEDY